MAQALQATERGMEEVINAMVQARVAQQLDYADANHHHQKTLALLIQNLQTQAVQLEAQTLCRSS